MEKALFSTSSSPELDPNRPVMLMATPRQLASAGLQLERLRLDAGAAEDTHPLYILDVHGNESASAMLESGPSVREQMLSVDEMAARMECTAQSVYQREQAGELFSVLPPGRLRGRKYPGFQLDPQLDRVTMTDLIRLFRAAEARGVTANDLWNYLRSPRNELASRSALDVLTRRSTGRVPSAQERAAILNLAQEEIAQISS